MLRYEYKYFVSYDLLDHLRAVLSPFLALDDYAAQQGGQYTVRSIYFDTPDWECYALKMAGVKQRNKVRLRGYNSGNADSQVFFEVKKKVGEPLHKHRASLSYAEAQQVLLGKSPEEVVLSTNKDAEAIAEAQRFLYHVHARRMRPVLTVIYDREPYHVPAFDKENDLRITFDKHLRSMAWPALDELFEEKQARPVKPQHFILEVKFNRYLPTWTRAILCSLGLTRGSASKYALCVQAHPELTNGSRRFL